ncbi:Endonuclease/exonuclease/phosphatase [Rhodotorula toruloides]
MRIVTYNVADLREWEKQAKWKEDQTMAERLERLRGDIVCLQETHVQQKDVPRSTACPPGWHSFWSFCPQKVKGSSIHGSAVFVKEDVVVPVKAEEGLTEAKALSSLKKANSTATTADLIGGYAQDLQLRGDPNSFESEGRTIVLELGNIILFACYAPFEGISNGPKKAEKLTKKLDYFDTLEARIRIARAAGKEVIVLGDLNAHASTDDSHNAAFRAKQEGAPFMSHPPRRWLQSLVGPNGLLIDSTRHFHPGSKMFSCWGDKVTTRKLDTMGNRVDYILTSPGLQPWLKDGGIQHHMLGSDHAPVFLDLHEQIEIDGVKVKLWDVLNPGRRMTNPSPPPPALAATHWTQFAPEVNGRSTSNGFFAAFRPITASTSRKSSASTTTSTVNASRSSSSAQSGKKSSSGASSSSTSTSLARSSSSSLKTNTSSPSVKGKKRSRNDEMLDLTVDTDDEEVQVASGSSAPQVKRKGAGRPHQGALEGLSSAPAVSPASPIASGTSSLVRVSGCWNGGKAMRILSWNLNGLKRWGRSTPWNEHETFADKVEALGAHVICFQETMLQQHELSTDLVDLPEFDAFFACATKTRSGFGGGGVGIHGTAAFARRTVAVPVKAEAGLTYRSAVESAGLFGLVGAYPPGIALRKKEESLEQDGRRIILDFGLFVLINVYLHSEGVPGKDDPKKLANKFERKMDIIALLDGRIKALQEAGREVIVIGDFNLAASDLDRWDPEMRAQLKGRKALMDHPGRAWLADLTRKNGRLVDVFRRDHSGERIYTWFRDSQAHQEHRLENKGNRVDYVLVSTGILPWVKNCSILSDVEGSDHHPLVLDLHDEIDSAEGRKLLRDEINGGRLPTDQPARPPPFAANYRKTASIPTPPASPPDAVRRPPASTSTAQPIAPPALPSPPALVSPTSPKKARPILASSAKSTASAESAADLPQLGLSATTSKKRKRVETLDLTHDTDDEIQILSPPSPHGAKRSSSRVEGSESGSEALRKSLKKRRRTA